jgi:hypothetical protein
MKVKLAIATALLITNIIHPVFAQEMVQKKEIQDVDSGNEKLADSVKLVCGNVSLAYSYDWPVYDTIHYPAGSSEDVVINQASTFSSKVSQALIKSCETPAYKVELGKLTKIAFTARIPADGDNARMTFKKDGESLIVNYNPLALNGMQDIQADMEKAF